MNRNIFIETGNTYKQSISNFDVYTYLPKGIYNMNITERGEIYLEKIAEKFLFNFKLYGVDDVFIRHMLDTYRKSESKHNLGVLLNGTKGTGKTVTAKLLCNELDLPVIILSAEFPGLEEFVTKLDQDVIFLIDEFEKNFQRNRNEAGQSLLSIMDGVYNNTNHAHIFILTTNELKINDNLISRPSRIRYIKSYGKVIDKNVLEEYIDDNLLYPERKKEIIEFIETLEIATIDILKSIVEEVNIHNCSVNEFKHFFNVKHANYTYCTKGWRLSGEDLCNDPAHGIYPYTVNEFMKDCRDYNQDKQRHSPWYQSICLAVPISKLKKGSIIMGEKVIVPMDENGILITSVCDVMDTEEFLKSNASRTYWYVENKNETPSIYRDIDKQSYDVNNFPLINELPY